MVRVVGGIYGGAGLTPLGWVCLGGGSVSRQLGGPSSAAVLSILAIVGTAVAPWQLFFQQSNVVDEPIPPCFVSYERPDTVIGSVVVWAPPPISCSAPYCSWSKPSNWAEADLDMTRALNRPGRCQPGTPIERLGRRVTPC